MLFIAVVAQYQYLASSAVFFHLSRAFFVLPIEAALKGKIGSQDLLVPSVLPEKDVCTAL